MPRWLAVPVTLALFTAVMMAGGTMPALARTAGDLLQQCKQYRTFMMDPARQTLTLDANSCLQYFYALRKTAFDKVKTGGLVKFSICVPAGVTVIQIIEIYLRYTDAHPEIWHEDESDIALRSTSQAFPCNP